MRIIRNLLILLLILGGVIVGARRMRANGRDTSETISVDGRSRTYRLHIPPSYDGNKTVPLVLALHGRLGTGEGQERLGHLDKVSDEHDSIVVYPDGLDRSWADGRGAMPSDKNNVDDLKFLSKLIDKLAGDYKIDPMRIYAAGMSNGGFMSGRLACSLADKIVAVGIVAASLSANTAETCKPAKPVSVLIMQGTQDPLVPFQGGDLGRNGDRGEVLSHAATVEKFATLNNCAATPRTKQIADDAKDGTSIQILDYTGCAAGTEVRGYTIEGGGHAWPGGMQFLPAAMIGNTSHNIDASETIWEFFAAHSR